MDHIGGTSSTTPGGGHSCARAMLASQLLQELLASAERDSGAVATARVRNALLLECRQLQLDGRPTSGKAVAVAGVFSRGNVMGFVNLHLCVWACPPLVLTDRLCVLV